MNNIETMRLALEALTKLNASPYLEDCEGAFDDEIAALRQAIEQAQQAEPVAWMSPNKESFVHAEDVGNSVPNWTDYYTIPLYTSPPVATNDTSQERVDETAKQRHEPVACGYDETTGNCTNNPCCYTSPPPRQPLTDEKKDNLANAWFSKDGDTDVLHRKAIALIEEVEAAHGIKEKNNG
jgi:hypothetical protein